MTMISHPPVSTRPPELKAMTRPMASTVPTGVLGGLRSLTDCSQLKKVCQQSRICPNWPGVSRRFANVTFPTGERQARAEPADDHPASAKGHAHPGLEYLSRPIELSVRRREWRHEAQHV